MFRTVAACAALVAFAALATVNAQVQPSPVAPSPVKRTILQKEDVPGTNLELIYATVEIAPGFKAGRHFHPGVAMALVVEGEFWFQLDGQPEKVLRAGESLTTPDRAIHNEGALGQAVKLTAVYVVEKGKPLASPAQ
jgi:quercetin dioxygenase-like cupin family protein